MQKMRKRERYRDTGAGFGKDKNKARGAAARPWKVISCDMHRRPLAACAAPQIEFKNTVQKQHGLHLPGLRLFMANRLSALRF